MLRCLNKHLLKVIFILQSQDIFYILYRKFLFLFVCFLIEFVNNATQVFLSFSKNQSAVSEDLQINSFWKTFTLYEPINSTIPVH